MAFIKLGLGFLFLLVGWIYLYRPNLVLAINRLIRDHLFNDRQVLLARKKLAILYFCLAFLALYMGLTSLARLYENGKEKAWFIEPVTYTMYLATQDYYAGRYKSALNRYQGLLKTAPDKYKILKAIAFTYIAMGENEKAKALLSKLVQLNPEDVIVRTNLKKLRESKK